MSLSPLDKARSIASRHLSRTLLVAAGIASASLIAACGGTPPDSPKDVAATNSDGQAVVVAPAVDAPAASPPPSIGAAPKVDRMRHRGVFADIEALDLRDDQRSRLDAIQDQLKARLEPGRKETRELADLLALGIEQGKVDEAAVAAKRAGVESRMKEAQAAFADAANEVHKSLDADQRTELVLTMRARRAGEPTPKEVSAEHGMHRVATEFGLSEEQTRALHEGARAIFETAFPDRQAKRERFEADRKAAEDAFMTDQFDAHQYSFGKEMSQMLDVATASASKVSDLAARVLTKSQRASIAAKIRTKTDHR